MRHMTLCPISLTVLTFFSQGSKFPALSLEDFHPDAVSCQLCRRVCAHRPLQPRRLCQVLCWMDSFFLFFLTLLTQRSEHVWGMSLKQLPFSLASLCVLGRMMTAKFLHGEIREKGGAYGGGARMGGGGLFSFYSYRCPKCLIRLNADSQFNWMRIFG